MASTAQRLAGESLPIRSGKGRFFLLQGETEKLECFLIKQERIVVSTNTPSILFVETHQFSWLKDKGRGALVAMRRDCTYSLEILIGVDLESAVSIPLAKGVASLEGAQGSGDKSVSYKKHNLGRDVELVFLNIVWAHESLKNISSRVKTDTTDATDGCYSFSKSGPDSALEPTRGPTVCDIAKLFNWVAPSLPNLLPNNIPPFPSNPKMKIGAVTFVVVTEDPDGSASTRDRLFPIPHLRTHPVGRVMALIPQSRVEEVIGLEGVSAKEYDDVLDRLKVGEIVDMHVVDYGQKTISIATRRRTLGNNESPTFEERVGTLRDIMVAFGDVQVVAAGGPLLPPSMWRIDERIPHALISVYGSRGSMPSRGRSHSIGHQSYIGTRGTPAIRVAPLFGPTDITRHDYWTQDVKQCHKLVALLPTLNSLVDAAKNIGKLLHRYHIGFLDNTVRRPKQCVQDTMNTIRLVTFGEKHSYASTIHADKLDIFDSKLQEDLLANLQSDGRKRRKNKNGSFQCSLPDHGRQYLRNWTSRYGSLDAPTTCGHASWVDPPQGAEIFHFFVMDTLGISARLRPGVVHSFFASRFTHSTSIGVMVLDGRVWTRHTSLSMLAWGAGKTATAIEAGARARVQRRRERREIEFGFL